MIFTHFNIGDWSNWLARLYLLLEPDCLLVFSTMSPDLLTEEEKDNFLVRDGLFFPGDNETQGRLNTLDYETAWVSWEWVSKQIEERYVGELCSFF